MLFQNKGGWFNDFYDGQDDSSATMSTMAKIRAQIGALTNSSTPFRRPSSLPSAQPPPTRLLQPSVRESTSLPPIASLQEPTLTSTCPSMVKIPSGKRLQGAMSKDSDKHVLRHSKCKRESTGK